MVESGSGIGRKYASFGELTWNHLQVQSRFDGVEASAGIAVGVAGGDRVPQAILATVEPVARERFLVLRVLSGRIETELGRKQISSASGPVTLTVTAFDDTVRAAVGEITIEAPRGSVRDGRAALVASGRAIFFGVLVDALDMYRFDFASSRYLSFEEHIDSYDGTLSILQAGAAGGTPAALATVLAEPGMAAKLSDVMRPEADPQARQALFTAFTSALGLPLRQQYDRLSLSRVVEAIGTTALLVETPEPISLTRDVTVKLVKRVRVRPPRPGDGPIHDAVLSGALSHVHFEADAVSLPMALTAFRAGDLLVRIHQADDTVSFSVYDAPRAEVGGVRLRGQFREMVAPSAGARPELDVLRHLPDGSIAVLRSNRVIYWEAGGLDDEFVYEDVPVQLLILSNGDETAALLIPINSSSTAIPIGPGKYRLSFELDRQRWRSASPADPESLYHQERDINLTW